MSDLDDIRKRIEEIDEKMARLYEERMKESKNVAEYKKAHALPILDAQREKELIKKNLEKYNDSQSKDYYALFMKEILEESKSYQDKIINGMSVAYSGTIGAFAHIASLKMFPSAKHISYSDFESAYDACVNGECDSVVLPIENSASGDVGTVMDLIFNGSLYINKIIDLEISQNLLSVKGASLKDIKKVYSHPQALSQCAKFLKDHGIEAVEYSNTALAAKMVSEMNDKSVAAIASTDTASIFGLEVLVPNINSSRNNSTRFAAFSRSMHKTNANHFILVFTVKNEAGALAQALNIIGINGFNMRNLRSRPLKGLKWTYYFYAEIEGNINTEEGKELLMQLKTITSSIKLVGTYE